jgi:hypothetical protein
VLAEADVSIAKRRRSGLEQAEHDFAGLTRPR